MAKASPFDPELVRELASLIAETDLTEIEVAKGDLRIRVARTLGALDERQGRLIDHDLHRGPDLVGTLSAYFANSSNFARTARALHIHTNTLTKRMDRISSLLGLGWQQPDVVLNLQLAVRLHDLARRVGGLPDGATSQRSVGATPPSVDPSP